ncbi:MAG: hypothetical protein H6739_24475 [Alphaproteobacteria bacterium]|nr:hypothetical protein [Alphaproteobacteria bacterium]
MDDPDRPATEVLPAGRARPPIGLLALTTLLACADPPPPPEPPPPQTHVEGLLVFADVPGVGWSEPVVHGDDGVVYHVVVQDDARWRLADGRRVRTAGSPAPIADPLPEAPTVRLTVSEAPELLPADALEVEWTGIGAATTHLPEDHTVRWRPAQGPIGPVGSATVMLSTDPEGLLYATWLRAGQKSTLKLEPALPLHQLSDVAVVDVDADGDLELVVMGQFLSVEGPLHQARVLDSDGVALSQRDAPREAPRDAAAARASWGQPTPDSLDLTAAVVLARDCAMQHHANAGQSGSPIVDGWASVRPTSAHTGVVLLAEAAPTSEPYGLTLNVNLAEGTCGGKPVDGAGSDADPVSAYRLEEVGRACALRPPHAGLGHGRSPLAFGSRSFTVRDDAWTVRFEEVEPRSLPNGLELAVAEDGRCGAVPAD